MNDYQVAVEKMIDETIEFYRNNLEALKASQPIIGNHFGSLEDNNKELKENKKLQQADITGISAEKKKAKTELSENIYQITGSLRSFAKDNNNDLLYEEIDEPKSHINKKSDEDVVSYCNFVIDKLTEYKKELEPYGVTAEDLVNLTKENEAFRVLFLKPAKMRKDVKVATDNIKKLVSKCLEILSESIDNDMLRYQDSNPALFKEYMVLREIDDSQTTAKSIMGTVHDADSDCDGVEDGCPLQYAKVTVKFRAGKAWKEMHAVSTEKGNYQFSKIPEGKCTLTFTLENYDSLTVDTVVHPDKFTRVDVKMKKTNG